MPGPTPAPSSATGAPLSSEDGTRTGRPGAVGSIRNVTTFFVAMNEPSADAAPGQSPLRPLRAIRGASS
jgi:hypothetical protein